MATINVNVLSVTDGEDSYELDINGKLDKTGGTMTGALIAPVLTSQGNVFSQNYNMENIGSRVSTAESSVSTLTDKMSTAESNISTLTTKMSTAEGNITSLGSRMGTAEGNITSLGSRMGTAESNITSHETRIGAVETSLTPLAYDTGWVTPSGNYFYRRVGLVCTVQILNASGNATKTLFTLPEGCRPREDILVSNYDNDLSQSRCHMAVYKSGKVNFVCDDTSATQYLAGAHATFIVA